MNRTLSVGVALVKDNKILLVKHGKKARHLDNVYGIPGGRIKDGETAKKAAVREFIEESGLETTVDDLEDYPDNIYYATIQMKHGPEDFSIQVFKCSRFSGTLQTSDETIPEWVNIDELDKYSLLPSIKEIANAVK